MKNKRVVIIIISIAVVLVIAGVVGACLLLENKKEENNNNIINDEQNIVNELTLDGEYDENVLDENILNQNTITETNIENKDDKQEENNQNNQEQKNEEKKDESSKETNSNNEKTNANQNSNEKTKNENKNTTQNTNSKPSNNSASKTETKTETKVESKPTVTGTDSKRELTNTETKYGVIIKTYTTTTYDIYSDGSRKEVKKTTDTEYDQSGYKASTAELQAEAKQLKSNNASLINGVLGYVNEYRKEANTKAVDGVTNRKDIVLDNDLTVAACARAMEMAYGKKFSHTRPNGSSCFTILKEMNITYYACGENIAYGQTSAKSVSNTWKNSSGHYANMIAAGYGKIGIGVIKFRGTYYWVQMFTN